MNTRFVSGIEGVSRSRLTTVPAEALLMDVAKLLSSTNIGLVIVCDAGGVMAGVITKTNIVQRIGHCVGSACTAAAAGVMTRDVSFCQPGDCLTDILSMMAHRGFVHIPVVDEQSRPLGVVNTRNVFQALNSTKSHFCGITSWVSATGEGSIFRGHGESHCCAFTTPLKLGELHHDDL